MGQFLVAICIVVLAPAAVILPNLPEGFALRRLISRFNCVELAKRFRLAYFISHPKFVQLIDRFKFLVLRKADPNQSTELSVQPDLSTLNCRVQLTRQEQDNRVFSAFTVEIAGSIRAPSDQPGAEATLRISITDVTDVPDQLTPIRWLMASYKRRSLAFGRLLQDKAKPVQARVKQPSTAGRQDSSTFCYHADLGKLPNQITTLSDWTAVAQLSLDWFVLPRKGKRNLQFTTSVLSRQTGQELACARCSFIYENPEFGYIDLRENLQRTKTLAVALAFAVSAADKKLYNCEIEFIKNWVGANFDFARASDGARRKFEKALDKTVAFFRDGNQLNIYEMCKEIFEIAPVAGRYDILDLCLHVAQAKGCVAAEELAVLKNLASWLEVDPNKFRAMMEKTLPVNIHQVKDAEVVLGVTSDMSKETARRQLNREYGKWNSRVTNSDPEIRAQADQMLELIAEARSLYVG